MEQEKKKKSKSRIEQIKEERDRYLAGWQRCQADFLNYKKQESERLRALVDYEKEEWALELLTVLDQFEKAKEEAAKDKNAVIEGFLQIQKYFEDFLKRQGIKEIQTKIGDIFNPEVEEVIETAKKEGAKEGEILKVIQKGYKYKDKVIRAARVRAAN